MTMIDADHPVIELTALDRCDGCGAQAVMVAKHSELNAELLFCDHHRREKNCEYKLLDAGWELTHDYIILEKLYGDRDKIPVYAG